ncbi:MAG: hypothetical protein M3N11_04335 [Actinomycetota bacterium]|nr:hypothetical protein [Actinomycetota bacterium]
MLDGCQAAQDLRQLAGSELAGSAGAVAELGQPAVGCGGSHRSDSTGGVGDAGWRVERAVGSAAAFHARPLARPVSRTVSVLEVDRPALVLGSTQPDTDAHAAAVAAGGVELVRRRSGGGAVLLVGGQSLWVDVVVPRGDRLWDDDVHRASRWLATAWVAALGGLGVVAEAHTGPLVTTRWSRLVCFAGLGPGEVRTGGRKLVGVSQRRTRHGARFQCLVLRRWEPQPLLDLLALDAAERRQAAAELVSVATGLHQPFPPLVAAFLSHLPQP